MSANDDNLTHALERNCTDADCELHQPQVGYREEVVSKTDLAFFYCGATNLAEVLLDLIEHRGLIGPEDIKFGLAEVRSIHIPTEAR